MNPYRKENYTKYLLFICLTSATLFLNSCASSRKPKNGNAEQVITTARSYRGTPYRYGGTTRSGIDCSALIYHAYASVGVQMPRTSDAQSKLGKSVQGRNLQKGDLVFFATSKNRRKVTHAGIVTEASRGRVLFIHSSTSLGVTEDNLDNPYWTKAYLFGRRLF